MAVGRPRVVISGPDRGTGLAVSVSGANRSRPPAAGSTLGQPLATGIGRPLASGFPPSDRALGDVRPDRGNLHPGRLPRPWLFTTSTSARRCRPQEASISLRDRGNPCPAAARGADGFPGSHGPPGASVDDQSLTFGYPAHGLRPEDHRSIRRGLSAADRGAALAAVALTIRQPSAARVSEGPWDRGNPRPEPARPAHGFPGSHGPPEASVNDQSLTFGYPAHGLRPEDHRSIRRGLSVAERALALTAVALTIHQPSAARVSEGPWDRGNPRPEPARPAHGFPGSHGPPEASVRAPSSAIRDRLGASPCHDRPDDPTCHDRGDDRSCHDRSDDRPP